MFEVIDRVLDDVDNLYGLYLALKKRFGKRGEKAWKYLINRNIKKYRDGFIVVGSEEYIVEDEFCTCPDFQINLKCQSPCCHIIAVRLAKRLKLYDEIDAYYVDFMELGKELR